MVTGAAEVRRREERRLRRVAVGLKACIMWLLGLRGVVEWSFGGSW